ncbi:hypothetical protein [Caulobacter sp. Root1472]|uniref:hypothetical protein n=1 Tax=Caulobacter sp. Root1472 TaxID=1736470 RepID=UPI0006F68862|nr:hypothetical protein [Caulobacter sp. Root1472]KQZ30958.1 hypothetical protein ASD47_17475 [Caulobacter sp. Root1472]
MAHPVIPSSSRGFDPADYGFDLNSREWATLIYLGLFLAWGLCRRDVRQSLVNVLKIVLGPKLGSLFAIMTVYVVGMVTALWALGAWEAANLKTTLVWWITVGFTAVSKALEIPKDPKVVGKMAGEAIAWTEIIIFLGEVHTLPLWGELILIPVLTLAGMLLVLAKSQSEHGILIRPLTRLQIWAGLGILGFSLIGILKDPTDFLTWNNLREFADPIVLSLTFIPFLVGLAMMMTAETEATNLAIRGLDRRLVGYVQRRALSAFGLDFDGARRLVRDIKLRDINDRAGVRAAIAEIKAVRRKARHPPPVDPKAGWSPFLAAAALANRGLKPGDYHRAFGSWSAEAETYRPGKGMRRPSISYIVSGHEAGVTRLRLQLTVNYQEPDVTIDALWQGLAEHLVGWALGETALARVTPRLLDQHQRTLEINGASVTLSWSSWGSGKLGGFDRILAINHPAHVETAFED